MAELSAADQAVVAEIADMQLLMSAHRRIDSIVTDPAVADGLKPWFGYMCKRPCFNDEYLDAFNRENVTLAAAPTGIDGITVDGIVVGGKHYEVDCIVFATGFETGSGPAGSTATTSSDAMAGRCRSTSPTARRPCTVSSRTASRTSSNWA